MLSMENYAQHEIWDLKKITLIKFTITKCVTLQENKTLAFEVA